MRDKIQDTGKINGFLFKDLRGARVVFIYLKIAFCCLVTDSTAAITLLLNLWTFALRHCGNLEFILQQTVKTDCYYDFRIPTVLLTMLLVECDRFKIDFLS